MGDSVSARRTVTFRKHSSNKERPANTGFDKYKLKMDSNVLSTIKEETASSVTYETVLDLLSVGSDNLNDVQTVIDRNKAVSKKYTPNKVPFTDFISNQTINIDDLKLKSATEEDRVYSAADTDKKTLHDDGLSAAEGAVTKSAANRGVTRYNQIKARTNENISNAQVSTSNGYSKVRELHLQELIEPVSGLDSVDHTIFTSDKVTVTNSATDRNEGFKKHYIQGKGDSEGFLSYQFRMKENSQTHQPGKPISRNTNDVLAFSTNKVVEQHPSPQHSKRDFKQFDTNPTKPDNSSNRIQTENSRKFSSPLLPMRRDSMRARAVSCSFQYHEKDYRSNSKQTHNTNDRSVSNQTFQNHAKDDRGNPKQTSSGTNHLSFPEVVEAVMRKPPKIHYSDFYKNARKAVAWRKRLEQPWMKGSEMQAFYKMWKFTSHSVPEKKLPKLVHRSESLPKNFKFPGDLCLHEGKERKTQQDFGIMRECCCRPKIRIKTFHEYH